MLPGETLRSGAAPVCPDCDTRLVITVCRSAAGYYWSSYCQCGPYSRESGYYKSDEAAEAAGKTDTVSWRDLVQ